MRYENRKELLSHSAAELTKTLAQFNPDYPVWIQHVDSIYPVTGVSTGIVDDMISLASEETYGNTPSKTFSARDLIEEIRHSLKTDDCQADVDICAEATCNPDETLDMQLTEACIFSAVGSSSITKSIYIITGNPVMYC